jgi:HemX protein
MTPAVLAAALALYVLAAAAYVAAFARPALTGAARAGLALAAAGFVVHAVAIGLGCHELGGQHLLTLRGAFGLVGWIAAGVHLAVQRGYRIPAAGAFTLPLVVMAVLPETLAPRASGLAVAPELVRLPALRIHVTAATAGVALFALAAGIGLMVLLQERELKAKRFGALFARLPSLHVLDRVNARLVALGFAVFTVALVTGSLVAKEAWCAFWAWDAQQIASLTVWALFGAMIVLRRAGVHGRRYAALTVLGFSLVLGSVVGVRQVPGATRHTDLGALAASEAACPGDRSARTAP